MGQVYVLLTQNVLYGDFKQLPNIQDISLASFKKWEAL